MRKVVALIVTVALAGSATAARDTASPASVDVAVAIAQGQGIVLLSTGTRETPPKNYAASLHVLRPKNEEARASARGLPVLPVANSSYESDFADHHGFVLALALAPGRYEFALDARVGLMMTPQTPMASFVVEPGKIVYVGELFLIPASGLNVAYDLRDEKARDLAVAYEKNPWLLDLDVIVRPLVLQRGY